MAAHLLDEHAPQVLPDLERGLRFECNGLGDRTGTGRAGVAQECGHGQLGRCCDHHGERPARVGVKAGAGRADSLQLVGR